MPTTPSMNPRTGRPVRLHRISAVTLALGVALGVAALSGCGEKKKEKAPGQAAARVNKSEITVHQINNVLQQQRHLRPELADAASRQVLERLIDQELAVQKADELDLDRDPRVVQQLDAARRDVLARAYLEKVGEAAVRPTADEVSRYYDEKPALFKERRIYSIQEIAIEARPDQLPALREKLSAARNIGEFVDYLKANEFRFAGNQAVRAAEQLPLVSLDSFARMKEGQAMLSTSPSGAQVIMLAGTRSQPVTLEQARPAIEQYILNDRRRKLVEADLKAQRAAARIEYFGRFAEGPKGAASAASDAALALPDLAASAPLSASAALPK